MTEQIAQGVYKEEEKRGHKHLFRPIASAFEGKQVEMP